MHKEIVLIYFDNSPLVTVETPPNFFLSDFLDDYARKYAFNRGKITGEVITLISAEDFAKAH